jgi:hypothetical protein
MAVIYGAPLITASRSIPVTGGSSYSCAMSSTDSGGKVGSQFWEWCLVCSPGFLGIISYFLVLWSRANDGITAIAMFGALFNVAISICMILLKRSRPRRQRRDFLIRTRVILSSFLLVELGLLAFGYVVLATHAFDSPTSGVIVIAMLLNAAGVVAAAAWLVLQGSLAESTAS